jgi:hypothetical protein
MLELVQITAQHSNALLVAILPFVSDFAQKLHLPLLTPLNPAMVQTFKPDSRKGAVGGVVTLTNGYRFWFDHGHVASMESPDAYFHLQDPAQVPRFFGPVRLAEDEVVALARKAITNLSYPLPDLYAHLAPAVTPPPQVGTNQVPRYRLQWGDPINLGTSVDIELNATNGRVELLTFHSRKLWRDAPKVAGLTPPSEPRSKDASLSLTESNRLLGFLLPQISEWSRQLKLPVHLPVTSNSVLRMLIKDKDWDVRIELTNGLSFSYAHGYVRGFQTQDTFWRREPQASVDEKSFWGEWKMGEKDAVAIVRDAVRRVAGKAETELMKEAPKVFKPDRVGEYVTPRYWIEWLKMHPEQVGAELEIAAEVDADKKVIKYLRVFNARVWRKLPATP